MTAFVIAEPAIAAAFLSGRKTEMRVLARGPLAAVAPGVGQVVLCSHAVDKGRAVKMVSGHGDCTRPLAERTDAEKAKEKKAADDEAAEVDKLMNQPMPAPSAANKADQEELEKIGNDSAKLQEYMDKRMNDSMQKAMKQMKQ